jgi:hypothetical protein
MWIMGNETRHGTDADNAIDEASAASAMSTFSDSQLS